MWYRKLRKLFAVKPRARRHLYAVSALIMVPSILLAGAKLASKDTDYVERLEVAGLHLAEHVTNNPPNGRWQRTAIRVTDDHRLEMDVHVPFYDDAQFIKSRNERIRYSYLKLACPSIGADVFDALPTGETVWIRLHYHGDVIATGACPLATSVLG